MAARAIDSATITFGLVAIPVKVFTSAEHSEELSFHFIHAGCGQRVKQRYVCPEHGEVERAEMAKGFELSKGRHVELSKDELEALAAVASNEIAITEMVPASEVDPILVDRTYYVVPAKGGERAYRLFRDAMDKAELIAIARYSVRGKQYVVALRGYEDGLAMHQLRYADEVRPWSEIPMPDLPRVKADEVAMAGKVIDHIHSDRFDPEQYRDEVKDRVRELIEQKVADGEEIVVEAPEVAATPVADIMAQLEASLAGDKPAAAPKPAAHQRTKRKARVRHAPRGRATASSTRRQHKRS